MSHNGFPNQVRTCSKWLTSERIVLSDKPAAQRASTNPANTSVSNRSISSGPAAARTSRRSRTTDNPTVPPGLQHYCWSITKTETDSEYLKLNQNGQDTPEHENPQVQQGNRDQRPQRTPGLFFNATPSGYPTEEDEEKKREKGGVVLSILKLGVMFSSRLSSVCHF